MASNTTKWDASGGWGGRTRKDGYRRNPATRFISDGDLHDGGFSTPSAEEEVRHALRLDDREDSGELLLGAMPQECGGVVSM